MRYESSRDEPTPLPPRGCGGGASCSGPAAVSGIACRCAHVEGGAALVGGGAYAATVLPRRLNAALPRGIPAERLPPQ